MLGIAPDTEAARRWHCVAIGRVQGVAYRARVAAAARHHRLLGKVSNRPDGSVHIDVQGPPAEIEAFLREIAGPAGRSHAEIVRKVAEFPPDRAISEFVIV